MNFKYIYRMFVSVLLLFLLISCKKEDTATKKSIEGVWEYVEDDVLNNIKGMSFFSKNYFAFVVNYNNESTEIQQNVIAYSGEYSLNDSIVTAEIKYAHNPEYVGQKLRWIHTVNQLIANYDVLDKDGKIVESGKLRRLE